MDWIHKRHPWCTLGLYRQEEEDSCNHSFASSWVFYRSGCTQSFRTFWGRILRIKEKIQWQSCRQEIGHRHHRWGYRRGCWWWNRRSNWSNWEKSTSRTGSWADRGWLWRTERSRREENSGSENWWGRIRAFCHYEYIEKRSFSWWCNGTWRNLPADQNRRNARSWNCTSGTRAIVLQRQKIRSWWSRTIST